MNQETIIGDLSQSGSDWNNKITRRQFLKRTGGATLAATVAWGGLSPRAYAGVTGESVTVPYDYTWRKFEYTSNDEMVITATGTTKEEALKKFQENCESQRPGGAGKATETDSSSLTNVQNMIRTYELTTVDGALPTPQPVPGGFKVTATFKKGVKFMVKYYK